MYSEHLPDEPRGDSKLIGAGIDFWWDMLMWVSVKQCSAFGPCCRASNMVCNYHKSYCTRAPCSRHICSCWNITYALRRAQWPGLKLIEIIGNPSIDFKVLWIRPWRALPVCKYSMKRKVSRNPVASLYTATMQNQCLCVHLYLSAHTELLCTGLTIIL